MHLIQINIFFINYVSTATIAIFEYLHKPQIGNLPWGGVEKSLETVRFGRKYPGLEKG